MCVYPDHTLPFGIKIATATKVAEETQPRLLGHSTPSPLGYFGYWRSLRLWHRSTPLPSMPTAASLVANLNMGSGRSPTPEHPTAIASKERAQRAWAGSWNPDGEAVMLRHIHALASPSRIAKQKPAPLGWCDWDVHLSRRQHPTHLHLVSP